MDVSTPYDTIRDAPLRADTLKEAIDSIADRTPTPPNREMMRLRDMLDERGIEWWPSDDPCCKDAITHWRVGPLQWTAIEGEKDLWLNAGIVGHEPLTPEQAIAATVGEEHEMRICKRCGVAYELNIIDKGFGKPRFCPNCGYREMYQ